MRPAMFLAMGLTLWASILRAEETLPVLKANGQVYSNATIFKVTATDIFFMSPQGMGNAKLKDLDPELQKHFRFGAPSNTLNSAPIGQKPVAAAASSAPPATPKTAGVEPAQRAAGSEVEEVVMLVAGVLLIFWAGLCFCFKRICEKCEVEPGILVWIPVFNLLRMLQVGGLSRWLFFLLLIPIVNVAMFLILWKRVCEARGKSPWLILMLFFPVLNVLFIAYLAFSD